jgi:hypothetical protein
MKIHPDKVLEYIDWFITNEIIKYGGSEKWAERKECRCGPATLATIIKSVLTKQRFVTKENGEKLPTFLDCELFMDPWYPEGKLVFWPPMIEIPNIPFVEL